MKKIVLFLMLLMLLMTNIVFASSGIVIEDINSQSKKMIKGEVVKVLKTYDNAYKIQNEKEEIFVIPKYKILYNKRYIQGKLKTVGTKAYVVNRTLVSVENKKITLNKGREIYLIDYINGVYKALIEEKKYFYISENNITFNKEEIKNEFSSEPHIFSQQEQLLNSISLFLGTPYKWGGKSRIEGMDEDALMNKIFNEFNYNVDLKNTFYNFEGNAQIGDILFFKKNSINSMAIYVGNNLGVFVDKIKGEVNIIDIRNIEVLSKKRIFK